ncbi:MAG: hypothetical protein KAT68_12195 [Bacteroidales bacterium]|nr:hypothetical protein [Bacteroidales bacterium]
MIYFKNILIIIFLLLVNYSFSQLDELEDILDEEMKDNIDYTIATFKSARIINGHSIEKVHKKEFDFRISHRFGKINSGAYELFGLDQASSQLRLDYGISDWLTIGLGRSSYKKIYDGYLKFSLIRQSSGAKIMPVSVSYLTSCYVNSLKWTNEERNNYFSSRLSYLHQILIARKFNKDLSLQISPTVIHRNLTEKSEIKNDLYSIGIGGRHKISKRVTFNAEYFYVLTSQENDIIEHYNSLSLGIDIETGGHVFQLIFTNSLAMTENGFIGETSGKWLDGDIHFGFNISRVFTFK